MINSFLFIFIFIFFDFVLLAKSPITSWKVDMYNQSSLKSQEAGNIIEFPIGSVTRKGNQFDSDGYLNQMAEDINWNDFAPEGIRFNSALTPKNPIQTNPQSIEAGKELYEINCAVCHGDTGEGGTRVAKLRGVPPINALVPTYTDGYLYLKITYGSNNLTSMPPYGFLTTKEERWEIVNYIKSNFK